MREFTSQDLAALQAPNADYNTTIAQALTFLQGLGAIGFHAVKVFAQGSSYGPANAATVDLQELISSSVRQDVPFALGAQFDGTSNIHNLGLLRRSFDNNPPLTAYNMAFVDIYGQADNWGRTATNKLLDVPAVREQLETLIKNSFPAPAK